MRALLRQAAASPQASSTPLPTTTSCSPLRRAFRVTDNTGGSGANGFTLVSVKSNQAGSGLGTGDVANDIQGWDIGTPDPNRLRAERYGTERIYTLTYRGEDLAGNTTDCLATVRVPKGK